MTSPTHAVQLEETCRRRCAINSGRCLSLGDYYCTPCEIECGTDPDPQWLQKLLKRTKARP